MMHPLRQRMIKDMELAGLNKRSQGTYLRAVDRLAAKTWRDLETLTEEDVQAYVIELHSNGVARGTFKTNWFGIRFLIAHWSFRRWAYGWMPPRCGSSWSCTVSSAGSNSRFIGAY